MHGSVGAVASKCGAVVAQFIKPCQNCTMNWRGISELRHSPPDAWLMIRPYTRFNLDERLQQAAW